jgi:fido (protein-threonine AMPylation protein)
MSTESELRDWRQGQVHAERLVAGLLHVEGYKKIDPQHPLGGPDGKKDVLFENDGKTWIAAAYFPSTSVTFSDIRRKFEGDLEGVEANDAQGIAFFVNQPLTSTERTSLLDLARPKSGEIFHLERMRAMLDAPRGCGLRLQHLHIPMSEEEQWAFWQVMNSNVIDTLVESDQRLKRIDKKLDALLMHSQSLEYGIGEIRYSLQDFGDLESLQLGPTSTLTPNLLTWIHRLVTESTKMPDDIRGRFRSVQVWVARAGVSLSEAKYVGPPPEEVPRLLERLLAGWRSDYPKLISADKGTILEALARFHHGLLSIHPFFDGNGRVARAIIDQAAHELLRIRISPEFRDDRESYYQALEQADRENFEPLITLFRAASSRG